MHGEIQKQGRMSEKKVMQGIFMTLWTERFPHTSLFRRVDNTNTDKYHGVTRYTDECDWVCPGGWDGTEETKT